MRTIAITNQKGGSGKTTTAVNLAAALAEKGERVLLVDIDPQGSATEWFGYSRDGRGLADVLLDGGKGFADLITKTSVDGVSIVPTSSWLIAADRTLAAEVGAETILGNALSALPQRRFSHVLVDCPPSLGLLSVSALVGCKELLIPVEARTMALAGLVQLLNTVAMVRERLKAQLKLTGILACRIDRRTRLATEVIDSLTDKFPKEVLKTAVRENIRLAEAWSHRQPITTYAPRSAGAEDYRAVALELLERSPRGRKQS
jgi:chromosome partitioning protein